MSSLSVERSKGVLQCLMTTRGHTASLYGQRRSDKAFLAGQTRSSRAHTAWQLTGDHLLLQSGTELAAAQNDDWRLRARLSLQHSRTVQNTYNCRRKVQGTCF